MRRVLVLLFALALMATLVVVVGCGGSKTIETPEGEISIDEDDGNVTIETDEGEWTYEGTDRPPTEEELGVAIYDGADYVPDSGGISTINTPEGEATTATGQFTTGDSFEDVVDFYTGELGRPMIVEEMDQTATWSTMTDEEMIIVDVSVEGGEVVITLSRTTGVGF